MKVRLPAVLGEDGKSGMMVAEVSPGTVQSVIDELDRKYPGCSKKLFDEDGNLYRYVNIFVNGDDVRHGGGLGTRVSDGDEMLILPAISGGA